jgi:hypothetical protein
MNTIWYRMLVVLAGAVALAQSNSRLLPGREQIRGAEVFLGTVQSKDGYQLRTFITRPQGTKGKLPVIFVVGWC